LYSTILLINR